MQIYVNGVIPCCQMDDPQAGTGSGGDRCTESVVSMIDCTYRLGPLAKTIDTGADPQAVARQVMFQITQQWNGGSNVSHLEDLGVMLPQWLSSNGYDKTISLNNVHNPSWSDIISFIDRGHMAVIGVNDYTQLHLSSNNGDPYQWPENAANAGGHVLMLIGYDPDNMDVIVDDPLRGFPGQPASYSFASLQAAGFSDLTEIVGPALSITGLPSAPAGETLCVDVSAFQGVIDWVTYAAWSRKNSRDGKSRVIIRASQDVATKDAYFDQNYSGAVAAGVDFITVYHYAYPQSDTAQAEGYWFASVVGNRLRPQDRLMLDFEENNPSATPAWVLAFQDEVQKVMGRQIVIYANLNMIQSRLQDPALASIPLVLADWTFDPTNIPTSAPAPFTNLLYVQYSDKGSVPGISGAVDMDVFLGGPSMGVPTGWNDDGSTLTAPNGVSLNTGMRGFVLGQTWDPRDQPQAPGEFNVDPVTVLHPEYGAGTRVDFVYSSVVWSRSLDKLFFVETGQEIIALKNLVAGASAAADTAAKALSDAQKAASDAQAAEQKAQDDLKAAQDNLATERGVEANLKNQVNALNLRIDSLNHEVTAETAAKLRAEQQLAAEVSQVNDLHKQVNALLAAGKGPENEDIKTQLLELSNSLPLLPEVKKVVDSIISKL